MILLDNLNAGSAKDTQAAKTRYKPDYSGALCGRLNDKWTVVVLWRIGTARGHQIRFSALKNEIEGVTQRMLTLTLRNLERDGLVRRHVFPEVPPRVEYELTGLGAGLLTALEPVNRWIAENTTRLDECRRAYDVLAGEAARALPRTQSEPLSGLKVHANDYPSAPNNRARPAAKQIRH